MRKEINYELKLGGKEEIKLVLTEDVFIPTGTTKVLINAISSYIAKPAKVLDLGCGCGAIGITLHKSGLVKPPLYTSDLSNSACDCTKRNAESHRCSIVVKCGHLFQPWENEKFDCIIDDVSGVAQKVAEFSPWFNLVPCESGEDDTLLVIKVIQQAKDYLNKGGLFFFPVVSLSNVNKIVNIARENFTHVKKLAHEEWPLPKEMQQYIPILKGLKDKGNIQIVEKFGMILWFTDVYVAYDEGG